MASPFFPKLRTELDLDVLIEQHNDEDLREIAVQKEKANADIQEIRDILI